MRLNYTYNNVGIKRVILFFISLHSNNGILLYMTYYTSAFYMADTALALRVLAGTDMKLAMFSGHLVLFRLPWCAVRNAIKENTCSPRKKHRGE